MNTILYPPKISRLEQLLAGLLNYGSWIASTVIGLGFVLALIDSRLGIHDLMNVPNMQIATVGIVLFILLPTVRVWLMLIFYIRDRDYRLAFTAAIVLTLILLGVFMGTRSASRIAE